MVLHFVRPRQIPTAAYHGKVFASLWIARDRPDCRQHVNTHIRHHLEKLRDDASNEHEEQQQQWMVDTCKLQVRRGNLLCIQLGEKQRIVYEWGASVAAKQNDSSSKNALGTQENRPQHCVAPQIVIQPSEIMEATSSASSDEPLPPFCVLPLDIAVRRPDSYSRRKAADYAHLFEKSNAALSERVWEILLPIANDAPRTPPTPQLVKRTPREVILEYNFSKRMEKTASRSSRDSKSPSRSSSRISQLDADGINGKSAKRDGRDDADDPEGESADRYEELLHESEREFSPYFYIVELAKFSETFWQRYDRTWWFDKTKTKIIDGMYHVVHCGVEPFAKITTDAYAGCFRVVQCSLDKFGEYSEPLLLEPFGLEVESSGGEGGGGLVRKIRSLQASTADAAVHSDDCSLAVKESHGRVQHLLDTVYADFEYFDVLFGFPHQPDVAVVATKALESVKAKYRASNRELVLLVMALHRLQTRVRKVHLRESWYAMWIAKFLAVERLVPELDCYPLEFFSTVTTTLHRLVQELFTILMRVSSQGWFRQYVVLSMLFLSFRVDNGLC